ncbi:STE3-domain-containing protein [Neolentinus lepideus HHB14362 ss-1]|uniref:STE3-domain-containing protein n=1 Tax=Neolentinus lepideus HHB14362 ss-1 TaxID=1314782 RepID=A0A165NFJ1_9AGAM|nr:STE3-domain-containing protein [Neolentinus lepideus HHB14362 ss-1]
MRPELPVVSFVCAALLLVALVKQRRSLEVPVFVILAWLLMCNLIHGVNSLINERYAPVWCDLVSKLELATPFAIAIADFCLSQGLESVSSKREVRFSDLWKTRIQAFVCVGIPIIYLLLSILVQDHRFDIVQNFGCQAAIYVSAPAEILLWLPILLLCLGTVVFSIVVVVRIWRQRADIFLHVRSRSQLAGLDLQVLLCMAVVHAFLLFYIMLSNLALSNIQPWTTLAAVHAKLNKVDFISTDDMSTRERVKLELDWCIVPTLSLVSLVSLAFGAKASIGISAFAESVHGRFRRPSFLLPMHTESMYSGKDVLVSPVAPTHVQLQKAVSDDSLRSSHNKALGIPRPPQSPPPAPPAPLTDPDTAFMNATLAYLGSPTAHHCGLTLPSEPPSIYVSHSQEYKPASRPSTGDSARDQRRESNGTLASSILAGPWPQPPTDVPFYGPGSGFIPVRTTRQGPSRSQPLLKPVYRRSSQSGRARAREVKRNAGTIYMTVVKESAA